VHLILFCDVICSVPSHSVSGFFSTQIPQAHFKVAFLCDVMYYYNFHQKFYYMLRGRKFCMSLVFRYLWFYIHCRVWRGGVQSANAYAAEQP